MSHHGDMPPDEFRRHGHALVDWIAEYFTSIETQRVLPGTSPGDLKRLLPDHAPESAQPFEDVIADLDRLILPHATHWNHPGFFAYFAITGSAPGVLMDFVSSALNQQAMLWRTSPAATELEEVTLGWLARLMHLPDGTDGVIYDTASISTLHALAAAREASVPDVRTKGLIGRSGITGFRVYCSEHAHSSVDKSVITLGLGHDALRRIPADDRFSMRADELDRAIQADRADGRIPVAVVASVGTTSTTSVDPVAAIADICRRHDVWLHVDAAYAGVMAMVPGFEWMRAGFDRADSLVVNPHKWLFTPFDLSVLFTRRMDVVRAAFSLTPEYLKTTDVNVKNLMDTGIQLGRRFRALKLWAVLRYFGAEGIRARLAEHVRLAQLFASWVDADPGFERAAPVPFSVVCFRAVIKRPREESESRLRQGSGEARRSEAEAASSAAARASGGGAPRADEEDSLNEQILERVNQSGEVFLSHTRLDGRFVIRLAVGNLRTEERHVRRAWELVREARSLKPEARS